MDNNTTEKCFAVVAITVMAVAGPKLGLTDAMFSIAVAAIAGLTGQGLLSPSKKKHIERAQRT